MVNTKFIAADIQNLTDARYFAAWGAEWLSFWISRADMNQERIDMYKEIMEWVDGPSIALQFTEDIEADEMMEFCMHLGANGIIADARKTELLDSFGQDITLLMYTEDLTAIQNSDSEINILKLEDLSLALSLPKALIENTQIYIDSSFNPSDLESNEAFFKATGLVLRGGEEEKVGLKSYDELDELFDVLETF